MDHPDPETPYSFLYRPEDELAALTTLNVTVNGQPFRVLAGRKLGFGTITAAVRDAQPSSTVTYHSLEQEGTLTNGSSVVPTEGMVFNVADTSAA